MLNNPQPTAQQEGQHAFGHEDQASLLDGGLSAVGDAMKLQPPIDGNRTYSVGHTVNTGGVVDDENGDPIGRIYTLAEVCDEIMAGVR